MKIARWLICAVFLCRVMMTPEAMAAESIDLGKGVVVAEGEPIAWVTLADGEVAAVDLQTGNLKWRSSLQGYPLVVSGSRLMVALEPSEPGELILSILEPDTGRVQRTFGGTLPPAVLASMSAMPNQRFDVFAQADGDDVTLQWFYQWFPLRGAHFAGAEGPRVLEGVLRVDLANGLITASDATPSRPAILLAETERIPELSNPEQYRSADDRSAQVSIPVEHESRGTLWRWQLYDRSSAEERGSLVLEEAYSPWLLRNQALLWRRERVAERAGDELVEFPARLISVDIGSGIIRWTLAIKSHVYLGPLPP